jgi:hypothetical protein
MVPSSDRGVFAVTRWLLPICILLATGALLVSFGVHGWWSWTVPTAVIAAAWMVGQWRQWGWTASVGLACCTCLAVVGLFFDLSVGWALLALVAALTAWDLDHLARRLGSVQGTEQARLVEARHVQRLLVVDAMAVLLAILALEIEFELSFTSALLLGLVAIFGLGQVVRLLRGEGG